MLVTFALLCSWPIFFFSFWKTLRFLSLFLGFWNCSRYLSLNLVFIYPAWYLMGSFNLKICVFPELRKIFCCVFDLPPSFFFFFLFFFFSFFILCVWGGGSFFLKLLLNEWMWTFWVFPLSMDFSFIFHCFVFFFLCCRFHWLPDNWFGFQSWPYYSFCLLDF